MVRNTIYLFTILLLTWQFAALADQASEPVVSSAREPERLATYQGKPISISARSADITSVLKEIAEEAAIELAIEPNLDGTTVTVEIRGIPWDQVLDQLAKINDLSIVEEERGWVVRHVCGAAERGPCREEGGLRRRETD